jgi:hypothetical protein
MRCTRELQSECQDGGVSHLETRWLVQRSRGARAHISETKTRMLNEIRIYVVTTLCRRLSVLHALINVLQTECRGFKIAVVRQQ